MHPASAAFAAVAAHSPLLLANSPLLLAVPALASSVLQVPALVSGNYSFCVSVSKDDRMSSACVSIETKPGLFPVLSCQRGSAEMIDQNPGKE